VTPQQVIYAATRAGALAQGRDDCGLVKKGFKADLCVLDVSGVSWCPANDMLTNVVYAGHGSDVVLTMCDGRVVYRDGEWPTIDVEAAKAEVVERTQRIQHELAQD
jgi:5-methylthioadenosine/S-adenosylhomocysteine deaminase